MAQQQASPSTINAAIAALRFFFIVLEKPDIVRPLRTLTKPRNRHRCVPQQGRGLRPSVQDRSPPSPPT
jgi:hypothetical protein